MDSPTPSVVETAQSRFMERLSDIRTKAIRILTTSEEAKRQQTIDNLKRSLGSK